MGRVRLIRVRSIVTTLTPFSSTVVHSGSYSAYLNGRSSYATIDLGSTGQDAYTFAAWVNFRGYGRRKERAYIVDNRVSAEDGFAWFVDTLATGDTDNTALEFMGIHAGDGMISTRRLSACDTNYSLCLWSMDVLH